MLPKRYNPRTKEPTIQAYWAENGIYHFDPQSDAPVFSVDTPPPTVSGRLHLGHTYSYSHTDFIVRYRRMRGDNIFYPMGYDDNGLPTERLVEKRLGITAPQVGREAFIEKCLQISAEAEKDYGALWQRLGLSIDWRYTYRTIDDNSRRASQLSFLDLYKKDLAYRKEAPSIWCPECQTAIAQAELDDLDRESEFITLSFPLSPEGGGGGSFVAGGEGRNPVAQSLPIATTRPELLPACVAIFIHPEDKRWQQRLGQYATVPLFGQRVPILADPAADPEKGTGVVMCCTFGDQTDVAWWHTHNLPLIEAIGRDGKMTGIAGAYAGLPVAEARRQIKQNLQQAGLQLDSAPTPQTIRIHERCDTPVEYISTGQWFVRVLDSKTELLAAGEKIDWYPAHMRTRYRAWVENLNWDWCISRQRYFGVAFPLWYCKNCGEILLADEAQLPVEPLTSQPPAPCPACGSVAFVPEADVMDTWATSSLSPQIVGQWLGDGELYDKVFPFSLRPQAHEIIRTWAFYTIAKAHYHFDAQPWQDVLISGWGLAGAGMAKISKSRGGGPMSPQEMIEKYAADAVRYWAASAGPGKDSIISEEKIQIGGKLITKIWNVARFSSRFLAVAPILPFSPSRLTPADRWLLSRAQRLVRRVTALYDAYEYAAAKAETETFFWSLADNYLEMAKQRLYDAESPGHESARYTLSQALLTVLKLFAPILPHITEAIYQPIFADAEGSPSIHTSCWPAPDPALEDETAERNGEMLLEIAVAVRRYKSEHNLSLGTPINRLQLAAGEPDFAAFLQMAEADIKSITRAEQIEIVPALDPALAILTGCAAIAVAIER